MKKALTVFLMLALVGSVFAAEPVANVNIADFSGEASVQWGVDLDAGKTGFKNEAKATMKLNLLDDGSKSTTGDGVWGELVIKTDGDTFMKAENGPLGTVPMVVKVDVAKLHFGPAYVGIVSGDTQTGELKMDAAIRSSDDDQAKWLTDVGPADFSQGIVAGYSHDMFNVAVDFRSYNKLTDIYQVTWTGGTVVIDGIPYNSGSVKTYFADEADAEAFKAKVTAELTGTDKTSVKVEKVGTYNENKNQYTNAYAFAAEAEFTGVENLSIKAGVSYNFSNKWYPASELDNAEDLDTVLGYSASAGYKLALDDTYYIRPQIGFTGENKSSNTKTTTMDMAFGLLFGWGDIGVDANAGVPFLDDDMAKKVSPGVGVVAVMPLVGKTDDVDWYEYGRYFRIMPSFFSGEIVPNLTAAAYSDIIVLTDDWADFSDPGMAVAVGAKYAIAAGDITVTPNMGIRFANKEYVGKDALAEEVNKYLPSPVNFSEKGNKVFDGMGEGATDDNYLNLKAGVDVTGLIDNTTLSVIYESRNLLNSQETNKDSNVNIQKLGTLNFKVKIAL